MRNVRTIASSLTGIKSCTREAMSCTMRRSNRICAVLIRRSSSPALSCCINRMNDSFAMRCGIRGFSLQTLNSVHEPDLTISIIQQSERQVKPCSLSAGSSLFRKDGTIKSETNPSNTALSRKVYRPLLMSASIRLEIPPGLTPLTRSSRLPHTNRHRKSIVAASSRAAGSSALAKILCLLRWVNERTDVVTETESSSAI